GQLTYSANWDHFEPVPFWDLLDVVGVTAYVQLSAADAPTDAELDAGWRGFRQQLRRLALRTGKPYLLTEVGYPAHPDGAKRPWDYRPTGTPDPALQARCYRSLVRTWHADERLAGVYIWNWFGVGGPEDRGYSPRDREAAQVLRHWYSGSRP
ncbi:MAG: hypothetical protein KC613_21220, partial [Myxococcales bacterium]|nr:hypothetical protein [Myxococcales bacterium]